MVCRVAGREVFVLSVVCDAVKPSRKQYNSSIRYVDVGGCRSRSCWLVVVGGPELMLSRSVDVHSLDSINNPCR